MEEQYLFQIKELLKKHFGYRKEVSLDFTIQSLNAVSEEIDAFFDDFGETFHIDGKEYNYYDYFLEDAHPFYILKDLFNRTIHPSKTKKLPITIEHLIRVAEQGKWFKPKKE
ncbi:DUF1493 family protein [Leadbetterella sp. DM7]|uniref:DUF1493 family protein n=1 Tax=Leadbetterella sp. DM7 TaxID=3235085 RepID=UPI00349F049B